MRVVAAGCQDERADREGCESREKVPVQVGGYKKNYRAEPVEEVLELV